MPPKHLRKNADPTLEPYVDYLRTPPGKRIFESINLGTSELLILRLLQEDNDLSQGDMAELRQKLHRLLLQECGTKVPTIWAKAEIIPEGRDPYVMVSEDQAQILLAMFAPGATTSSLFDLEYPPRLIIRIPGTHQPRDEKVVILRCHEQLNFLDPSCDVQISGALKRFINHDDGTVIEIKNLLPGGRVYTR